MSQVTLDSLRLSIEVAWIHCESIDDGEESEMRPDGAGVGDRHQAAPAAPVMIFLHEGLGSVALWKDFPQRLCHATGLRGLVYSRPGYGRSTPRRPDERWGTDFMHRQALEVLPALRSALGLASTPVWLFGHSDGASIALLHAAHRLQPVAGLIAMAPHVCVEPISIQGIQTASQAYGEGLRERLSRFHDDVDSAFHGWAGAWLSPEFVHWNIAAELAGIQCPTLLVQGLQDDYGTMAQLDAIGAAVPQAQRLELDPCGHSPHRDQPDAVISATCRIVAASRPPNGDLP
ncbi:MAG: alpha/beta fold hydrolase [Burkholderiales bacterium]|jgi:pimeloyl-ACP methyl ester carboxylesterase